MHSAAKSSLCNLQTARLFTDDKDNLSVIENAMGMLNVEVEHIFVHDSGPRTVAQPDVTQP
jgi:hypothetical protein